MKKSLLIVALLGAITSTINQSVAQSSNAPVVTYCMPKVELTLDIEYQQITRTKGPFYQYAERYLGEKNIVMQDEKNYSLTNAVLVCQTQADQERAFTFTPSVKSITKFQLNKKGILCAIGEVEDEDKGGKKESFAAKEKESKQTTTYANLLEDAMLASSIGKMAEGAAKQIYHIREARLNLLTGEVEHMPADGQSLKQMLARLDAEEEQLTALFVGTITKKTLHHTMPIKIEECSDKLLFRFSEYEGPVSADELSGVPYFLSFGIKLPKNPEATEKKQPALSPIYYNIPAEGVCSISDGEETILTKNICIPQLGICVPLSADIVRESTTIRFSPQTGQLIEIK